MMLWTDERIGALRKLWGDGLSASQIAAQMGGISRNAVIGKVHRLKLAGRGRATAPPLRQNRPAKPPVSKPPVRPAASRQPSATAGATALQTAFATVPQRAAAREESNILLPISRHLTLIQLDKKTCKWPIGDPLAEGFHFCGNDADGKSYCRYHGCIAYQPVDNRSSAR